MERRRLAGAAGHRLCVAAASALLWATAGCGVIGSGDGVAGVGGGDGAASGEVGGGDSGGGVDTGGGGGDAAEDVACDCPAHKACVAGVCGEKACAADADCNPPGGARAGDAEFFCPDGTCRAWQCADDSHCAAPDKCNTVTYRCYTPRAGCSIDAHCVDDDPCTDDTCDAATGACSHATIAGCCKVAVDCDDADPCTTETCEGGKCVWKGKGGCCSADADCDDGDACTVDTCGKAGCSHAKDPDCCVGDAACDDGDDATLDSCVGTPGACVHSLASKPQSCKAAVDCAGSACAKASCVGGLCSFAATFAASCCSDATSCALGAGCKASACTAWSCTLAPVAQGAVGPHLSWDFEAGLDGWVVDKGNQTAFFHAAKGWAAHGEGALRYGVVDKQSWAAGFPNKGTATSPAFTVPAKGRARFLLYFDGEPGAGVHLFGLSVVSAGKAVEVWSKNADLKGNTAGAWKQVDVDLAAYAGKSVQLRWAFDVAVNYPVESGHGLTIDAGVVEGSCP